MNTTYSKSYLTLLVLLAITAVSIKLGLINIGGPYTTIDDNTLFNAGFLVWFGEAPPQRVYLESWITGIISLFTYTIHLVSSGNLSHVNIDFVAHAYQHFQQNPSPYILNYRLAMLAVDLATAWAAYQLSKQVLKDQVPNWLLPLPGILYLLCFNTLWCDLVARPDTVTALLTVLGISQYIKSNYGENKNHFYLSAILLGAATGMKLHAAIFVVGVLIDVVRVKGVKTYFSAIFYYGLLSVFLFCLVAGSPLFDPLLYIKLRLLNIEDDASPWIHSGDQIITLLNGTGWLVVPAVLAAYILLFRGEKPQALKSLAIISGIALIVFASTRVLRGYWMLPALPFFYLLATYAIAQVKQKHIQAVAVTGLLGIFATQLTQQTIHFKNAHHDQLQTWVKNHVKNTDVIYILGYDTLFLPLSQECIQTRIDRINRSFQQSINEKESFTMRHVRLWEERAELKLLEMQQSNKWSGYNYYSLNGMPPNDLDKIVGFNQVKYVLVMKGITNQETAGLLQKVQSDFTLVTEANAPGGKSGTGGLTYQIYKKVEPQ